MIAIEVSNGQRVFAPSDSNQTEVNRQLAKREKKS
jgi:hypothetical protein